MNQRVTSNVSHL